MTTTVMEKPKIRSEKIAELNDLMRILMLARPGKVIMTRGVNALEPEVIGEALVRMKTFSDFEEGNDPYGERDFGAFEIGTRKFFWKIGYYDKSLEWGSDDPTDPEKTTRVLTIMLAEEY